MKYSFSYYDLNGILKACGPLFKEQQVVIMQNAYTEIADNGLTYAAVETTLLHESGQWAKTDVMKVPIPKTMYSMNERDSNGQKNTVSSNMQDLGAQFSFLKRYSLYAALGISMSHDDAAAPGSANGSRKIPATLEEAEQVVVTFGISKGKTLKEIWFTDFKSIEWLEKNARDENIKAGIRIMREVAAQANAQGQQAPQPTAQDLPQTAEEAAALVIQKGPHAGKTLREIYLDDYEYFVYIKENIQHAKYQQAVRLMELAIEAAAQKSGQQVTA